MISYAAAAAAAEHELCKPCTNHARTIDKHVQWHQLHLKLENQSVIYLNFARDSQCCQENRAMNEISHRQASFTSGWNM